MKPGAGTALPHARRALQLARRLRAARERSAAAATHERGPGLTVRGLADYEPGGDARRIDWLATLRVGRPVVREYHRDKERVVAVALDCSPSLREAAPALFTLAGEIAAALSAAAALEGELAGGWRFTEAIEDELPPGTGRPQASRALAFFTRPGARGRGTDLAPTLARARALPRGSLLVVVSDFAAPIAHARWRALAGRLQIRWLHLRAAPPSLPPVGGWVRVRDSEGGAADLMAGAHLRRHAGAPPPRVAGIRRVSLAPGEPVLGALIRLLP